MRLAVNCIHWRLTPYCWRQEKTEYSRIEFTGGWSEGKRAWRYHCRRAFKDNQSQYTCDRGCEGRFAVHLYLIDDYRIIREDLFGNGGRNLNDREPVSYSVFIDPPLSRIGLSEEEAVRKGLNIKVNKLPVAAIPRARTLGNTVGLFKVVVDVDTDQIVGCTLFGPESGEVINSVAMAMKTDQPYTFLRDFVFTHPSMSEALNDLMNF